MQPLECNHWNATTALRFASPREAGQVVLREVTETQRKRIKTQRTRTP